MGTALEALMLVLFGLSWPVSVRKSWVSKRTGGKSLLFLCFIEVGYICGLIGKIIFNPSYVIAIYCMNLVFVTADILLYLRNRKLERQNHPDDRSSAVA